MLNEDPDRGWNHVSKAEERGAVGTLLSDELFRYGNVVNCM